MGVLIDASPTAAGSRRQKSTRKAAAPGQGRLGDRGMALLLAPLLAGEAALLVAFWEPSHWQPLWLVLVLAAAVVLAEFEAIRIGDLYVSSTFCALLLALTLLGPVPAVTFAAGASTLEWLLRGMRFWIGLGNIAVAMSATLAGAIAIETLAGPRPFDGASGRFAAVVFLAGLVMAVANIALLGTYRKLRLAEPFRAALRDVYLPSCPYHVLGITLATAAAQIVIAGDFPTVAAVIPALLLSEFLLRSLAADRARTERVTALTNERANLLEQALGAEEGERAWLAGHLHDETLQTLAVARQEIDDAANGHPAAIATARKHLDTATEQLRLTLSHVHPGSVTCHGLGPALETYAAQVFRRTAVQWRVAVAPEVGDEHRALLYSLARELLGNAAKHARATRVSLTVTRKDARIRLCVNDDGVGIARGATEAPGHFGLLTVRHRIEAASGTMVVEDGHGTRIVVELPAAA